MPNSKAAAVRCGNYTRQEVQAAIDRSLELLGGMKQFVKPGMRVLLKCNLVMKKKPEEGATTHPEVAAALAGAIREAGGEPIIGDSPGGLFTEQALRGLYKVCGMEEIAKRDNIPLNYGTGVMEVQHPDGRILKKLTVIELLKEVDAVISVAKLKTHGMTLYTGAVKNLFGVIPGTTKAEYHFRMKKLEDFSEMLIDICTWVKPVLSFIDGVTGMEGNGPTAGEPRDAGVILASADPFALDVAGASLINIPPEKVCTIRAAAGRGICSGRLEDIELVGDPFGDLILKDFKVPQLSGLNFVERFLKGSGPMTEVLSQYLTPRPAFIHDICVGCRECEKNCPPKAITMRDGKPYVNLKECIRCYCCQELCPRKAVDIKRHWVFKIFK